MSVQLRSDAPDALMRVLTTLARRRCEVLEVHFVDRGLAVRYVPPPNHAHCVLAWVRNLVDVVDAEAVEAGLLSVA